MALQILRHRRRIDFLQGPQRLSIRNFPHDMGDDHRAADLASPRWSGNAKTEEIEHRSGDPRGTLAGASGQERHSYDGRSTHPRSGVHLDDALGEARQSLHVASRSRDRIVRNDRVPR